MPLDFTLAGVLYYCGYGEGMAAHYGDAREVCEKRIEWREPVLAGLAVAQTVPATGPVRLGTAALGVFVMAVVCVLAY